MSWWDGLWLNEGFASFMEYIGTNSTEPSFNMVRLYWHHIIKLISRLSFFFHFFFQLEQFVADDFTGALNLDGLNESHPILQTVGNPDEINSLFDSISYSKVRMYCGTPMNLKNAPKDKLLTSKRGQPKIYSTVEYICSK